MALNNVSDIFNFTKKTKKTQCTSCSMRSVNDIFYLLQDLLRELPSKNRSTDVYEFDAQTDGSSRVSAPFHSKSKQGKTRAQGSKVVNRTSEDENKVYLLKAFPEHVVEVTLSRDDILKACLTPLSQAPVQRTPVKRKVEPSVNKSKNTPKTTPGRKKKKEPLQTRASSPKPSTSKRSASPKPVKSRKSTPMTASQRLAAQRLKKNYTDPLLPLEEEERKKNKQSNNTARVVEAPTFYLTEEEFDVSTYRFNYAW